MLTNAFYLLCLCSLHASHPVKIVRVDEIYGDDQKCLQDESSNHATCKNLTFVSSQLGNGSAGLTILLESNIHLENLASFTNCKSLTILSDGERRTILGSMQSSGLYCGLQFYNVTNLTISNITVTNCRHMVEFIKMNRSGAIHVHQSANISIDHLIVSEINGTALIISDLEGHNRIENSNFKNNYYYKSPFSTFFAGGIHIQFKESSHRTNTILQLNNCHFSNNTQSRTIKIDPKHSVTTKLDGLYGYGTGGGMGILFMSDTQEVHITIESCAFSNNKASLGAGLYVHFQENATNNSLRIIDSHFEGNRASMGGGLSVGFGKQILLCNKSITFNRVSVSKTVFTGNSARIGGGTSLFAVHSVIYAVKCCAFTSAPGMETKLTTAQQSTLHPFDLIISIKASYPYQSLCTATSQTTKTLQGKRTKAHTSKGLELSSSQDFSPYLKATSTSGATSTQPCF